MPDPARSAAGWVVVLPVKELAVAKSRLALDPGVRADLALAMAQDVAAAALAAGAAVLVVTDDPRVAAGVPATWVEPDRPRGGLSAAASHGATVAARHRPTAGIAVLAADVPAMTVAELTAVLTGSDRGSRHPGPGPRPGSGVVADAAGIGTVLLTAVAGTAMAPDFEGGSFGRHRAAGSADLTASAGPGLRRDVDTVADLAVAVALGVGPATAAALAHAAGLDRADRDGVGPGVRPGTRT